MDREAPHAPRPSTIPRSRPSSAIFMRPLRRRAVQGVAAGVWATGVAWLLTHTFLQRRGEFGAQAHPSEPWWLRAHAAFAFASIWLLGLLWGTHIAAGWAAGRRRGSGVATLGAGVALVLSGYLLYYVTDESLRSVTSIIHWAVGLAAAAAFAWHRLKRRKPSRPAREC